MLGIQRALPGLQSVLMQWKRFAVTTQGWEAVGQVADRFQCSEVLGDQRARPGLQSILMR
jgi:hypothetical protein